MKSQTAIRICKHCNNLGMKNTDHHVSKCPVLAETTCFLCKKKGHTSGYCPEKKAKASFEVREQNAPVANGWAQIVKKAMTDKDKAESEAAAAKVKADIAEKKKREHDAYLERKARREAQAKKQKARREAQAKKQKEYDDKRYQLFSRHMFSLFGYGWMHRFHEYGSNDIKIPERLFDRLKKEIEEEEEAEWREEQESNKIEYEERAAHDALRCEKMATLSEKEYEKWEDDYWSINMDEIDDWLDYTANDFSNGLSREDSRIREGKIWIEEKMKEGKIREISEGKFEYYP